MNQNRIGKTNREGGRMDNQRSAMFSAALISGSIAGAISGIPFASCLCCFWIIGGGMLAAYLLAKSSSIALSAGDGAIVGVFTGLAAAVVRAFVNIPFRSFNIEIFKKIAEGLAQYGGEMPSGFEDFLESGATQISVSTFLIGLLLSAIVLSGLGALGSIIGISLFGKKISPGKTEGVTDVPQDTGDSQS
jgi:voltage-gated potassium channel Kch